MQINHTHVCFFINYYLFNVRSHAIHQSSTNAASLKQKRRPEDVAWHPNGNSIIFVYSADGGDSQIGVMNLNKGQKVTP